MILDRYELIRAGIFRRPCTFTLGDLSGQWNGESLLSFPALNQRIMVRSIPASFGGKNRYLVCGDCSYSRVKLSYAGGSFLCRACAGGRSYSVLGRIAEQQDRIETRLRREYDDRQFVQCAPSFAGARRQALVDRWCALQELRSTALLAGPVLAIAKLDGLALPDEATSLLKAFKAAP
jgi:hypothetical protein